MLVVSGNAKNETMGTKYKSNGPLGHVIRERNLKRWILVFEDGEEMCIERKKYAEMATIQLLKMSSDIHLYEETVQRFIMPNHEIQEDTFRIEITHRYKQTI